MRAGRGRPLTLALTLALTLTLTLTLALTLTLTLTLALTLTLHPDPDPDPDPDPEQAEADQRALRDGLAAYYARVLASAQQAFTELRSVAKANQKVRGAIGPKTPKPQNPM